MFNCLVLFFPLPFSSVSSSLFNPSLSSFFYGLAPLLLLTNPSPVSFFFILFLHYSVPLLSFCFLPYSITLFLTYLSLCLLLFPLPLFSSSQSPHNFLLFPPLFFPSLSSPHIVHALWIRAVLNSSLANICYDDSVLLTNKPMCLFSYRPVLHDFNPSLVSAVCMIPVIRL